MEKIGVAIIILDETHKKILLCKRKNAYLAGAYGLPGGRIELTEQLKETVQRELQEETNLITQKITYVGVVKELQMGTYNFIHFIYSCEEYSGELKNKEPDKSEGWEWHSLDNIPDNIIPGHKAGIEIFKNKGKNPIIEIL